MLSKMTHQQVIDSGQHASLCCILGSVLQQLLRQLRQHCMTDVFHTAKGVACVDVTCHSDNLTGASCATDCHLADIKGAVACAKTWCQIQVAGTRFLASCQKKGICLEPSHGNNCASSPGQCAACKHDKHSQHPPDCCTTKLGCCCWMR